MRNGTQFTRGRGRPRQFEPAQAIWKAVEVFWDNGYSGTSLDQLSAATRINRPSLYAAFGDKRAIYLRALSRFGDEMRRAMLALADSDEPLAQSLRTFYYGAITVYTEHKPRGCLIFCTAPAEAVSEPEIRAMLQAVIDEIDLGLTRRFIRAAQGGELGDRDPAQCAAIASSVLQSIALRARAGKSQTHLRGLARAAIRLLFPSGPRASNDGG